MTAYACVASRPRGGRSASAGRRMLIPVMAMAIAVGLAGLAGCAPQGQPHSGGGFLGYGSGEEFDESIRSVAVPIFENRTFYRETEFRLADALVKEIEHRTPY